MNQTKDYFKLSIIPKDVEGIRPDIACLINTDVNNYREHMIKQYNGDDQKATDEYCFRRFLNEYSTAISIIVKVHSIDISVIVGKWSMIMKSFDNKITI